MNQEFLTIPEVAKKLSVSVRSIQKLIWSKQLPFIRIGRLYRIRNIDLETFIKQRTM